VRKVFKNPAVRYFSTRKAELLKAPQQNLTLQHLKKPA